ncbi:MAG: transcriptional regulator [Ignavibacteriae bacterium HGW-Ignavibacteriae-2]|jgi:DNA-binding transcriptional ArsR family regulator|nr:metalloregulator ArsR/SmtB family transcription factor [Bacteroidota bacterium]PKL87958.1 MAG: transcriptional regulator [Ignavibacteriae bacterium HGW-Ignavibacteriae-2]
MAVNKKELFSLNETELAEFAKALSHPARIKILKILNEKNVCITGEIVELLPLAQSTVSQHLKELKNAGLIIGEVEGPKMCYCINAKVMNRLKEEFIKLFSKINCC